MLLDPILYRTQRPFRRRLTAYVDVAVIGIPAETVPSSFQFFIERIRIDVGQQRFEQFFQVAQQFCVLERRLLPASTLLPYGQARTVRPIRLLFQFGQAHGDGAPGNATGARHQRCPAPPMRRAFGSRPQPARSFIQPWLQLVEALLDFTFAGHENILGKKCFNYYSYCLTDTYVPEQDLDYTDIVFQ